MERSDILEYDNFFCKEDYAKILDHVYDAKWGFGHGSYPQSDPRSKNAFPFWVDGI